jgi:hypothetical protein
MRDEIEEGDSRYIYAQACARCWAGELTTNYTDTTGLSPIPLVNAIKMRTPRTATQFSFLHPLHGSICCGLFEFPHFHAMNPVFFRRFLQTNFFGYNRLAYGLPIAYMYAVRYITTRKPHARSEEDHHTTEAQSRFSRREAHSTPAHRRFQIHQEPFQPTLCFAQNP